MFCNILIIDKRKELSYKYKKSLESPMVSVNIAHNMAEGLEFVENYESDLILISDSLSGSIPDFCERPNAGIVVCCYVHYSPAD